MKSHIISFPLERRSERRRLLDAGVVDIGGHQIDRCCAEYDYYYAILYIGTPSQRSELVIDTGSSLTYLACASTCRKCGKHDDPYFDTDRSSSLSWVPCSKCPKRLHCNSDECTFKQSYLDGSSNSGRLFRDRVDINTKHGLISPELNIGCSKQEGGVIYSQNADGVLGLGMEQVGITNQLKQQGVSEMVFSHCFTRDGEGVLIFGNINSNDLPDGMQWESLVTHVWRGVSSRAATWYRLKTKRIFVGEEMVNEGTKKIYTQNKFGGTVFDSGSTDFWLPGALYDQVKSLIIKQVGSTYPVKRKDSQFSTCFEVPFETALRTFPKIIMEFEGGAVFDWLPLNYLVPKRRLQCLGIFKGNRGEGIALGSTSFINVLLVHDRERGRMGWARVSCTKYKSKFLGIDKMVNLTEDAGDGKIDELLVPMVRLSRGHVHPPPASQSGEFEISGIRDRIPFLYMGLISLLVLLCLLPWLLCPRTKLYSRRQKRFGRGRIV